MIFGIGSGLFFAYMPFVKMNGIPVTSFRPLPGIIFSRATKRLNIEVKRQKYKKPEAAMSALDQNLEKGIPTGLLVGVYHLTYFPRLYRFHFNAHNIVVYGRENGHYHISDSVMEGPEQLSHKELERVRYAYGLFAPHGHMYHIINIPEALPLETAIARGIKKTARDMTEIPIPLFGAKGIQYMAKQIKNYPKKLNPRKASMYLGQIVRSQEEIGTGGAGFRFIYAAFLQEASEILNQKWLWEMSERMTLCGDEWRRFAVMAARIVKERNSETESYEEASKILSNISKLEKGIFTDLKKLKLK